MEQKITIGFSPCPNDTYIFDALVNRRINTAPYVFEPVLADVEQLNKMALEGTLDVTKISVAAYPVVSNHYIILDSGAALGKGVGPLLVSTKPLPREQFNEAVTAIPGEMTTANLLLAGFFPELKQKKSMIFSDVAHAVTSHDTDLGLLIHEGRFTYKEQGLTSIMDLGSLWEEKTSLPLPLGCIAASRKMSQYDRKKISSLIAESILFAQKNPGASREYIHNYAQEMDEHVIEQHIQLYVNEFSIALRPEGRKAIQELLHMGVSNGLLKPCHTPIFD